MSSPPPSPVHDDAKRRAAPSDAPVAAMVVAARLGFLPVAAHAVSKEIDAAMRSSFSGPPMVALIDGAGANPTSRAAFEGLVARCAVTTVRIRGAVRWQVTIPPHVRRLQITGDHRHVAISGRRLSGMRGLVSATLCDVQNFDAQLDVLVYGLPPTVRELTIIMSPCSGEDNGFIYGLDWPVGIETLTLVGKYAYDDVDTTPLPADLPPHLKTLRVFDDPYYVEEEEGFEYEWWRSREVEDYAAYAADRAAYGLGMEDMEDDDRIYTNAGGQKALRYLASYTELALPRSVPISVENIEIRGWFCVGPPMQQFHDGLLTLSIRVGSRGFHHVWPDDFIMPVTLRELRIEVYQFEEQTLHLAPLSPVLEVLCIGCDYAATEIEGYETVFEEDLGPLPATLSRLNVPFYPLPLINAPPDLMYTTDVEPDW